MHFPILKYGNSALKKATSKKVEDYTFESEVLNPQIIDFKKLKDSLWVIKVKSFFYPRSASGQTMTTYDFDFTVENNFLNIKLSNIEQEYIPVKIHRNSDFILSNFNITISRLVREHLKENETVQEEKMIDLGASTINIYNRSLQAKKVEAKNEAQFFIPSLTKEVQNIKSHFVNSKIKGTTSSILNDFLQT